MAPSSNTVDVYLEIATKRTLAGVIEWPGWCRMGRDEATALQALVKAGPRYARILRPAHLDVSLPRAVSAFVVVERLEGNATTDFGAPALAPASDTAPISDTELQRLQAILKTCWQALDVAAESAEGKTLRTGPRGGGRTLAGILQHVRDAEKGYLSRLGGKLPLTTAHHPSDEESRKAILETLGAAARGEIPAQGPRGGKRWLPRYFVRRLAWHVLDHAWEIEDRLM